jgi:hypothetical protein
MPKASELPASLKPLALRNAIQVRNTNFGSDAEQLITKMREALALRPEHTQGLVLLSALTTVIATFLLNLSVFFAALMFFFTLTNNYAGSLAAMVAFVPFLLVGRLTLARNESVKMFGLVISVVGLLVAAAIVVSPQFFQIDLFDSDIQRSLSNMSIPFMISAGMFGASWKNIASVAPGPTAGWGVRVIEILVRMANSPWLSGLTFLSTVLTVRVTPKILYHLTDSVAAALALVGVQLLVVGLCYAHYRKVLAAIPE